MVVYPHWRGELLDFIFFAARFCGLSPLARGTRTAQTGDQTDGAGLSPLARGTLIYSPLIK
ncbi:hypothetical protein ECPA48_3305 [Escherichia coli PA48]|nr:hypothetical protein ECEC96038_3845 [Escherichia coli EC96038]EKK65144.1 hypothetical protein EC100869_3728 [Escherichia coli 10.0869]ELV97144.1 hypothetical protein ECPA48_3305 [Escherichia coli PA48]